MAKNYDYEQRVMSSLSLEKWRCICKQIYCPNRSRIAWKKVFVVASLLVAKHVYLYVRKYMYTYKHGFRAVHINSQYSFAGKRPEEANFLTRDLAVAILYSSVLRCHTDDHLSTLSYANTPRSIERIASHDK